MYKEIHDSLKDSFLRIRGIALSLNRSDPVQEIARIQMEHDALALNNIALKYAAGARIEEFGESRPDPNHVQFDP